MQNIQLTDDIFYIGTDDKTLDLFEGQYVIPNGISYNSYVIKDTKIAVMDTADKRVTQEWFANLKTVLKRPKRRRGPRILPAQSQKH